MPHFTAASQFTRNPEAVYMSSAVRLRSRHFRTSNVYGPRTAYDEVTHCSFYPPVVLSEEY
jgi:hypothetical protein